MAFRPLHDRGRGQTPRGRREDQRRHHHPRYRQGEASGRQSDRRRPGRVKANDRILFGKWSGTEVKIGDEELLIMKESDILGIVD